MGARYTVAQSFTLTLAGGSAELFYITPADDQIIKLRRFMISNGSEVAEAQEEELELQVIRLGATLTVGSGGSAFTVGNAGRVKRKAAALTGATIRYNDTTLASSSGTTDTLEDFAWNERASPYDSGWYDDADAYDIVQGEALAIRSPNAIADDMTLIVTVWLDVEG